MRLSAAFVIITIISTLSNTSAKLCKCIDSDELMGCSCCIKAPIINEGCARVNVKFPKFEVTGSLESNGKELFKKTIGAGDSNICLPTPPISPCIGLTHILAKEHYLELCPVVSASIPLLPKLQLNLPCMILDHGKPTFTKNKFKQKK